MDRTKIKINFHSVKIETLVFLKKNRTLIVFVIFLVLAEIAVRKTLGNWFGDTATGTQLAHAGDATNPQSLDAELPFGKTLTPVTLINSEQIEAFVGPLIRADLYYKPQDPSHGDPFLVLKNARVIRPSVSNHAYAVLLDESQSAFVIAYADSLFAVIKNSTLKGQEASVHGRAKSQSRNQSGNRIHVEYLDQGDRTSDSKGEDSFDSFQANGGDQ